MRDGSEQVDAYGVRFKQCDPRMVAEAIKFLQQNGINKDFGTKPEDQKAAVTRTLKALPKFADEA